MNAVCAGGMYPVQPSLYGPGSGCCDAPLCMDCHPELSAPGNGTNRPSISCNKCGMPASCDCMSADIPWLMPKAYGCGRVHKCADDLNYPNLLLGDNDHPWLRDQLNGCALPGRPPHRVLCVHALGITPIASFPGGSGVVPPCCDPSNHIIDADGYDLVLNLEVPLEMTVEDCCGFQFCLRSYIKDALRIPLCVPAQLVKCSSDMLYLKSRVRLCEPYLIPPDVSANASSEAACTPVPSSGRGIPLGEGGMRLEVLMEACVMKLLPYGVMGFDPTVNQMPSYIR